MNARLTLATAVRVLQQVRHDPRIVGLLLIIPCALIGLLAWVFSGGPVFDQIGAALLGVFPFVVMFLVTSVATLRERQSGTLERLLVRVGERRVFVSLRQVRWMEAARNYVTLHVGRETFTVRGTLAALEERIDPAAWVRVNRSQLINLDAVTHLEPWFHGEYHVVLRDGTRLTWSRRYLDRAGELLGR